jgi:4-amino-4-deoxy-L-arabinose transferase-like glycosyltransferase
MNPRLLLWPVLGLYVLLCAAFIDVTPFRTGGHLLSRFQSEAQLDIGAPDERQHVNYVRHISDGKGFPVFDAKSAEFRETYQSHQPPLYYLLAASLETYVHESPSAEKWVLRFLNVLLGVVTVLLIVRGVTLFTGSEAFGAVAGCFVALMPMFIGLSSAVTNDMLLYCLASAMMAQIAFAWVNGWSTRSAMGLGLLLGLALLTKTTALLLIPAVVVGMCIHPQRRARFGQVIAVLLLAVLVSLPWLLRNQNLYGDPFAMAAFREASVGNLDTAEAISRVGVWGYWSGVIEAGWKSFIGVFGYFDIFLPDWAYILIASLIGIGVIGLVIRWCTMNNPTEARAHWLCIVLAVFVKAGFVAYNLSYFQAQARYLYPAVFAFGFFVAAGYRTLAKNQDERFLGFSSVALLAMFGVDLYIAAWVLPSAFAASTMPL